MAQLSHAKLEIPRLDPPREPALAAQSRAAAGKNRTSRACDHCRNARAKCSGGEPCKRCGDMLTKCAYSEGKRELHKKLVGRLRDENGELSRKTQLYATMLNSLSQHPMMPQSDRDAILDLLTNSTVESQSVSRSHEFDSETDTELSRSRGTSDRIDEHGGSGGIPGLERTFASYSPFVPSSEAHTDTASKHDRNHLAPAESWTNVTNNGGLVEHLLALYFCWEYPTFASLSRKHFLADFHAGKRRYCSSLLVNALLALGSRFSDMPEARKRQDDPDSAGEHFFEECKRLLGQEEFPSLPTIQALGLMSLRQASHGNDGSSWSYARQSMRMALDLDLHLGQQIRGLPETPLSQEEIEVCTATFWGCYNLEQAWCLCLCRLPQADRNFIRVDKPAIVPEIEDEDWIPYTDNGQTLTHEARQRSQIRTVYKTFTELCEIVHDTILTVYSPSTPLGSKDILFAYTRYLEWYDGLPDHLRLGHNYTPSVLFTHMFYHFAVILLFRPFLNLTFQGSSTSPQIICIQAAESITSLVQSYRQLYTLRRTPSFVPYMILTSDLALLIANGIRRHESKTMDASYHDVDWVRTSEELSVPHPFARKSTDILRHFAGLWQIPMPGNLLPGYHQSQMAKDPDISREVLSPKTFFRPRADLAPPAAKLRTEGVDLSSQPSDIFFSLFPAQEIPLLASASQAKKDLTGEGEGASDQFSEHQLEHEGFVVI